MNNELTFEEAIKQIKQGSEKARETVEIAEQLAEIIGAVTEARIEKGLTQRQLAELSGIKQSAIARMESVQAIPRLDTLVKIANCLGVKLKIESKMAQPLNGTTVIINLPNYQYGDNWLGSSLRSLAPALEGA